MYTVHCQWNVSNDTLIKELLCVERNHETTHHCKYWGEHVIKGVFQIKGNQRKNIALLVIFLSTCFYPATWNCDSFSNEAIMKRIKVFCTKILVYPSPADGAHYLHSNIACIYISVHVGTVIIHYMFHRLSLLCCKEHNDSCSLNPC